MMQCVCVWHLTLCSTLHCYTMADIVCLLFSLWVLHLHVGSDKTMQARARYHSVFVLLIHFLAVSPSTVLQVVCPSVNWPLRVLVQQLLLHVCVKVVRQCWHVILLALHQTQLRGPAPGASASCLFVGVFSPLKTACV